MCIYIYIHLSLTRYTIVRQPSPTMKFFTGIPLLPYPSDVKEIDMSSTQLDDLMVKQRKTGTIGATQASLLPGIEMAKGVAIV